MTTEYDRQAGALGALRAALERRPAAQDPARSALEDEAGRLDAEFGAFDVTTTAQARNGYALTARRRAGASEPGLYAVVTADPDEMRAALEQDSPPGGKSPP